MTKNNEIKTFSLFASEREGLPIREKTCCAQFRPVPRTKRSDTLRHMSACNPSRGPRILEIESTGDAVDIKKFAG